MAAATRPRRGGWPMPIRAEFGEIIARIEEVTLDYLSGQVEAGAEALQLFDSWAGSLSPAQFEQWVIAPTARLVAELSSGIPTFRLSAFPKGAGGKLAAMPARRSRRDRPGRDRGSRLGARELPDELRCRAISTRWR